MNAFAFTKATKEQAKLRLAIFGPSGSGKTFTSLRLATGLGGTIAVVDTERGSASKYAGRFEFDVLELSKEQRDIDSYCQAIDAAQAGGYNVLILDSLTHAWKELLAEVDTLTSSKYRGNKWRAWSEGTPKQRQLVDAILGYDGHVIATMRTKTEWTTETTDAGKLKPVRVGLAPEQGKGIEYEFDLLMELSTDHIAQVIKDRTGKYQDKTIEKPGEELGQALAAWLMDGNVPAPKNAQEAIEDLYGDEIKAEALARKAAEKPTAPPVIDWDKFNPEMPTVGSWGEVHDAAVERLRYNHAVHVKNTLKKVFNGSSDDLTYVGAWSALVDHQREKRNAETEILDAS